MLNNKKPVYHVNIYKEILGKTGDIYIAGYNSAKGITPSVSGVASLAYGRLGLGYRPSTVNVSDRYQVLAPMIVNHTLCAIYEITSTPSLDANVFGWFNAGSAANSGFITTNTNYRAGFGRGAGSTYLLGDTITVGRIVVDILTVSGNSIAYYQDGVLKNSNNIAFYQSNNTTLFIGGNDSVVSAPMLLYGGFYLDYPLTSNQITNLVTPENIWNFCLANSNQRIWTPAASSGQENTTPILTNPNATNVGFTTVSPSVRVEY